MREREITRAQGRGRGVAGAWTIRLVLVAVSAALLSLGSLTPSARAEVPELLAELSPGGSASGSGAGQFKALFGSATDPKTGHIFLSDPGNSRIDEFTPWGGFVKAFGWNVAPGPVNEQQEFRYRATGGQFRLTFGAATTGDLPYNASAAAVESALNGLSTIGGAGGSVSVGEAVGNASGTTPYVFVVTFKGSLAASDVSELAAANGTQPLTGGDPSVGLEVRTRANGAVAGTGLEACTAESGCQAGTAGSGAGQFGGGSANGGPQTGPTGVAVDSAGDVFVVDRTNHRMEKFGPGGNFVAAWGGDVIAHGPGNSATDEEQEVVVAASSGTFKLSLEDPLGGAGNATTGSLPFNATAGEVEAALNGLSTVASHGGSVSVTGGPGDATGSAPYLITFEGNLAGDDVPQLRINRSALGSAAAGSRLVCSTETWAQNVEYAWLRNGVPIASANGPTYTTTAADEGKDIQCQIFAINANAGSTQVANPPYIAPPAPGTPPPTPPTRIQTSVSGGQLEVGGAGGAVIACSNSGWSGATSFSYRWYRNGVEIPGATAQSYTTISADLAKPATFQCEVIGTNAGGSVAKLSENQLTEPTKPSPPAPGSEESGTEVSVSMESVRTVTPGGGPEVCQASLGDACKAGVIGDAAGEFRHWPVTSLVSIGSGDTVYVGDAERIQEFEADGAFKTQIPLAEKQVSSLAAAPSGNIYVGYAKGTFLQNPEPNAYELSPAGTLLQTLELGNGEFEGVPQALASDASGNAWIAAGVRQLTTNQKQNQVLEFSPAGTPLIPLGTGFAAPFPDAPYQTLATNTVGNVLVSFQVGENPYLNLYGQGPIEYESPPAVPPEIRAQFAAAVGTESATLRAIINPNFWPDATYRLEYGIAPCSSGGCTETAFQPLTTKSINQPLKTGPVDIGGLAPNTVYHFRFVAVSGGGGPVFGLSGKTGAEAEGTFRTFGAQGAQLPDSRAYELVSPPFKDGGEAGTPTPAGGEAQFSPHPLQAAIGGGGVTYGSVTAFGANPQSAPATSQYLSTLGSSWGSSNINPKFEEGYLRDPFDGFSPDLSRAVMMVVEPSLTPDAVAGFPDLYLRENSTGALTAITTEDDRPTIAIPPKDYCVFFGGASDDYSHVVFGAKGALLPGDPIPTDVRFFNLYEWSKSGGVHLLSVLPNEAPAVPAQSSFGQLTSLGSQALAAQCNPSSSLLRQAVSSDGSVVYWTYHGVYEGATEPLFARVHGAETVEIDARQGLVGAGGEGKYWDASRDGSRVFFTDTKKLTTQSTAAGSSDLYRYDFSEPMGSRLLNLTAHTGEKADVKAVLGASEDGSFVYFVANGVLTTTPNGEGEVAAPGAVNIYVWHEGDEIRFIGRLRNPPGDLNTWEVNPEKQTVRVSADGRHLAFLSTNSLTGFDNTDSESDEPDAEAFLYSYDSNSLACPSCNQVSARPQGPAFLKVWSTPYQQPRYLLNGGRLVFETMDVLSPRDTNKKRDVYEFEPPGTGSCTTADPAYSSESGGCVYLLSTGQSGDESYFVDASSNGETVFISTRQQLDPYRDRDGAYDVYAVRVGGTAPHPEVEQCQGHCPAGVSGEEAGPPTNSATFTGPPNSKSKPKHRRCPKGRVRRHGHCVRKKHSKHRRQASGKGRRIR